jgi:hypothetical protein
LKKHARQYTAAHGFELTRIGIYMITEEKLAANRRNAQLSTGPKTDEGKAASSMNRLRDGLYASTIVLPHEDPAEFQKLRGEYQAFYQPANVSEQEKVDQLAGVKWKTLRAELIEANYLFQQNQPSDTPPDPEREITMYNRINQVQTRLLRLWNKLDKELRIALDRRQPPPAPKPKPEKPKPEPKLTQQQIDWRDSRFRPEGMRMGAIRFGIKGSDGRYLNGPALIWNGKHVDEFPPEAYLGDDEEDPNPPGGLTDD